MTRATNDPTTTDAASDRLLQRYLEANALDDARPAPRLRDAVLARAREQSTKSTPHLSSPLRRTAAANDRTWTLRALGTLAALGLVGLLVLQFDQGTPDEREAAFGPPPLPSAPSVAQTPAPATEGIGMAPEAAEAPAMARGSDHDAETAAAPKRPAPAAPQKSESAPPRTSDNPVAAPPPVAAPAPRLEPQAPGANADLSPPASLAERSRAAAPSMARQAPRTASAEAPQAAPEALPAPALLRAAQTGDLAMAREAIARGDDLNAADVSGRTALMAAAARGDLAMVRLLLDAGADATPTDRHGLSAADLARQAGHDQVLDLL
ncbi:hypothetical protein J2W49_005057 [Hydrogenophaga palleronii]|uniref:Ankyrin repeat protein n=1 Tax=Hydrogenophaga palleronii TaxID=65655 RepID=A0ABU1WW40_9BURK|nr:ankyrin repeat domain-containing protein [Hydrogenophaga palleronii]MDR7153077.1 hypothetical protein [Hydrogenophaga palleronii]